MDRISALNLPIPLNALLPLPPVLWTYCILFHSEVAALPQCFPDIGEKGDITRFVIIIMG